MMLPSALLAQAQQPQASDSARKQLRTITLGFTPQYIAINGIRLDIEFKVNKLENSIRVSPVFYGGTTQAFDDQRSYFGSFDDRPDDYEYDEVLGAGIELAYAHYLTPTEKNERFFMGYGIGFHYITYKWKDYGLQGFQEDGLTFYTYDQLVDQHERMIRVDAFLEFGLETKIYEVGYFILAAGPAYRTAFINNDLGEARDHNYMGFASPGHEGPNLKLRFTLGVFLK